MRTVAIQNEQIVWSDDLKCWNPVKFGLSQMRAFRLFESALRRIQTELRLPFLGLFDSFRFADACYQTLKGYDILYERHGWMGYGSVIASRWLHVPLVEELNGNIIKEIESKGFKLSALQWKISVWITRRTFISASQVVVVSRALKGQIVKQLGLPEEHVSVVLNGADLTLFNQHRDSDGLRNKYHLDNKPMVIFVSSFEPWHGVDLLVTSFKSVISRFPEARLVLVGDGSMRDAVFAQIEKLGLQEFIILTGKLPHAQVAEMTGLSDIAVAPYPYKHTEIVGTPLKLIEYMAAGKAIVASTAPIHEIIEDGITGIRVSPADPEALAEGINRLLSDDELRGRLSANAQKESLNYSWEHVSRQLSELLIGISH